MKTTPSAPGVDHFPDQRYIPKIMADDSKIVINVPMSGAQADRVRREEHAWTSTKLVILAVVTLSVALVVLYLMASTHTETTWTDWLDPR